MKYVALRRVVHNSHGWIKPDGATSYDGMEFLPSLQYTMSRGCCCEECRTYSDVCRDGRDGRDGLRGPVGPQGSPGKSCECLVPKGTGVSNICSYSFTSNCGAAGRNYKDEDEIVIFVQPKCLSVIYLCIAWSTPDTTTTFDLNIEDVKNNVLTTYRIGPTSCIQSLHIDEYSPSLSTLSTRLLRLSIRIHPCTTRILLYSIMVGFN